MSSPSIKLVYGGALISSTGPISSAAQINELFEILRNAGINTIDTAQIYGDCEEILGQYQASSQFTIDTKHCGGWIKGQSSAKVVVARGKESLKKLQTNSVDIFYLHAPDHETPIKETLSGINELYKTGAFRRFGLSNFNAEEVEEVIKVVKENDFVLPSVYQGNYSPVTRKMEDLLLPILRKHKIAFYVYSPLAGGFLTKTKEDILEGGKGRWDPNTSIGKLYNGLYKKPALLDALTRWGEISKDSGIPKYELAYRWVAYNSVIDQGQGDAVIFGASNSNQLKQTIAALKKGPLPNDVAGKVDTLWETVKHEAPLDNYNTN